MTMFNERSALERMFNSLEEARQRRYEQHLDEMKRLDEKQAKLFSDLRRIDELSGIHTEIIEEKKQTAAVTIETKKHLATMTQDLVAPLSEEEVKKGVEPEKMTTKVTMKKALEPIYEDGKRIWPDGTTTYQCYYVCPSCNDRGKQYVKTSARQTYCKSCSKQLKIEFATSKGFPHQDGFGNYYIAGKFQRVEDHDKLIPDNPVDSVLAAYEAGRSGDSESAIAAAFRESAKIGSLG